MPNSSPWEEPSPIRNQHSYRRESYLDHPSKLLVVKAEDHLNHPITIWEGQINPEVWDTRVSGKAKNVSLVLINLNNPSQFPH